MGFPSNCCAADTFLTKHAGENGLLVQQHATASPVPFVVNRSTNESRHRVVVNVRNFCAAVIVWKMNSVCEGTEKNAISDFIDCNRDTQVTFVPV